MKKILFLLSLMLAPLASQAAEIASPNGNMLLKFYIDDQGRPTYELNYKNRPVVLPSHLGLELAKDKHASRGLDERDLMDHFTLASEQTTTFDETWKPVWGETATIRNHYVDYAATLLQQWKEPRVTAREGQRGMMEETHQRTIIIRFRVYDDGIGLR